VGSTKERKDGNKMSKFKELIESCGIHPKGLARILSRDIYTIRHWVAGNRPPNTPLGSR
jgi:hypothetical protein